MSLLSLLWIIFTALCFGAIVLYVTWLFVARARKGEPKFRSFGAWLKHLMEAVWGL
jgi:hypothetical protein